MKKTDHTKGRHANAFKPKNMANKKAATNKKSILFASATQGTPERKNIDVTNTAIVCPGGGVFRAPILCNPITTSNQPTGRIGRRLTMTSFQIRYTCGRASGSGPSQVRFLVVYDKQANGSTPSTLDILFADRFDSPMALGNGNRFLVLCDEISESRQSTSVNISGQRYVKMSLESLFSGTTGTAADFSVGAVWLLISANDEVGGAETVPVDCITRIRYTDV